jgi:hypothetical protein
MEWILVLTINATASAQVTQAPVVLSGFTTESRCLDAGQRIAEKLMLQAGNIKESKGEPRNKNTAHIWSDCIAVIK